MSNKPLTAKTNDKGHFEVGGCDTVELAKQFGTPLYVVDELTLRHNCRQYVSTLKSKYPNSLVLYASKALCNTAVLKMVCDEGLGLDVSSGGELYTAKKANLDLSKVYFHGNNKPLKELEEGVAAGVNIVADNLCELKNLDQISKRLKMTARVMFRINPGIEAHTHEFIQTGKIDSKFGIQKDKIIEAAKIVSGSRYLTFIGLHTHIGSQIFDIDPFVSEADVLFDYAKQIKDATGLEAKELDFGGGWGVSYIDEKPAPVPQLLEKVIQRVRAKAAELKIPEPKIIFEPGRSIISPAGITLYTIGSVKEIPGIRKYAMIDGGMSDNPRPILYDAQYDALIANKISVETCHGKSLQKYRIAGRFCESGDILIKEIKLPKIDENDILAVMCTGAYGYSMASNYNRVCRPPMVVVNNGKSTLILKRETYEDLVSQDVIL
ncbi:MAG: diaminopimelate decarboxylase [Candidatus Saganbacteria bacterium]|nr:diaminopimelate decarboxylase [Candidatus Saganbacteria bacterium]